jgi:hypothetical protein
MGILDDARALQSRKRTDRLLIPKQKKIKGATYKGKDPIDGTDIIEVDGDEPVSGFRLISNKPISTGDRVSLRPSKGGLQRADAPNVAPTKVADEVPPDPFETFIYIDIYLGEITLRVDDFSSSTFIVGIDYGIRYSTKIKQIDKKKLNEDRATFPDTTVVNGNTVGSRTRILNAGDGDDVIGSITLNPSVAPYYTYKVQIPCATDYFLSFDKGISVSGLPKATSFDIEGYASIDGGSFALISSFTHTFPDVEDYTADTRSPPIFPDPFEAGNQGDGICSEAGETSVEVYVQWRKTGSTQWFSI